MWFDGYCQPQETGIPLYSLSKFNTDLTSLHPIRRKTPVPRIGSYEYCVSPSFPFQENDADEIGLGCMVMQSNCRLDFVSISVLYYHSPTL